MRHLKNRFGRGLSRRIIGAIRNCLASVSFSSCLRCNDSWAWKKYHRVPHPGGGMIPCCEECWQQMNKEDKKFYCNLLVDRWETGTPRTGPHGQSIQHWIEIRKGVEEAIEKEVAEKLKPAQ